MTVVFNCSPLIFLCKIRRFELLCKLYKNIIIPQEVMNEFQKKQGEEVLYLNQHHFTVDKTDIPDFKANIHKGEAAAIALALEKKARFVLLDDHHARIVAEQYGLNVIGTLGILLLFLKKKVIDYSTFRKDIQCLVAEHNMRLSIEVYNLVLMEAEKYK